jgi:leucyl aminopeptidase
VVVVGVFSDEDVAIKAPGLSTADRRRLVETRALPGFKGGAGETIAAGPRLMMVGLGRRDDLDRGALRKIGGKLVRALDRAGVRAARLDLVAAVPKRVADARTAGQIVGEGIGLANWRVDFFDGTATKHEPASAALSVTAGDAGFRAGLRDGLELARCVNEARRVAATPPNICNPTWVASEVRRLARKAGLVCRVITYREAERQGMGGIVNVGKGSAHKPCLIVLEHKPTRPRRGVKIALVGKTMTYDTGGYSLKMSNGMKGMKYDGNGGCAVLGAMLALAARKAPVHAFGLLPCAENMVSGDAYRPDDIIEMYNGVSVEVTNTDAEGRLILGDALAYACKKIKPTAILDAATLTGGVVVALGSWCAGLFCNDDDLVKRVERAAGATDERVWRLPLWDDHRDFMRAKHADVWNSGPKRDGHPIQGAAFLSYFVDEDVPWAHIDIAGVSTVDGDSALHVAGPTGFGVRLLTEVVEGYA